MGVEKGKCAEFVWVIRAANTDMATNGSLRHLKN